MRELSSKAKQGYPSDIVRYSEKNGHESGSCETVCKSIDMRNDYLLFEPGGLPAGTDCRCKSID